jgi:sugar phosphate isomerase/epimerase
MGISTPTWYGTSITYPVNLDTRCTLERAVQGVAAAGLDAIELCDAQGYCEHLGVEDVTDERMSGWNELLQRHNLTPAVLSVSTDLTQAVGLLKLAKILRIARHFGVTTIVTAIQTTSDPDRLAAFLKNVPQIQDMLDESRCVLALETHRGYFSTGMQGVELLSRIDSPQFRMTYDTANVLNLGGVRPEEELEQLGSAVGEYIRHVHLKDKATLTPGDRRFTVFGQGVLEFDVILRLLRQGGYSAGMTLEMELDGLGGPDNLDRGLQESVRHVNRCWELADHGL